MVLAWRLECPWDGDSRFLGTGFTPPAKPLLHSDWRSGSDYALHKSLWGDSFSENFRSECRHAFSTLDQDFQFTLKLGFLA